MCSDFSGQCCTHKSPDGNLEASGATGGVMGPLPGPSTSNGSLGYTPNCSSCHKLTSDGAYKCRLVCIFLEVGVCSSFAAKINADIQLWCCSCRSCITCSRPVCARPASCAKCADTATTPATTLSEPRRPCPSPSTACQESWGKLPIKTSAGGKKKSLCHHGNKK